MLPFASHYQLERQKRQQSLHLSDVFNYKIIDFYVFLIMLEEANKKIQNTVYCLSDLAFFDWLLWSTKLDQGIKN